MLDSKHDQNECFVCSSAKPEIAIAPTNHESICIVFEIHVGVNHMAEGARTPLIPFDARTASYVAFLCRSGLQQSLKLNARRSS
jgi:hypothetical protein